MSEDYEMEDIENGTIENKTNNVDDLNLYTAGGTAELQENQNSRNQDDIEEGYNDTIILKDQELETETPFEDEQKYLCDKFTDNEERENDIESNNETQNQHAEEKDINLTGEPSVLEESKKEGNERAGDDQNETPTFQPTENEPYQEPKDYHPESHEVPVNESSDILTKIMYFFLLVFVTIGFGLSYVFLLIFYLALLLSFFSSYYLHIFCNHIAGTCFGLAQSDDIHVDADCRSSSSVMWAEIFECCGKIVCCASGTGFFAAGTTLYLLSKIVLALIFQLPHSDEWFSDFKSTYEFVDMYTYDPPYQDPVVIEHRQIER